MKGEQRGARVLTQAHSQKRGEPPGGSQGQKGTAKSQPRSTRGGGTDSPEPVYGQKSQVPTNPRRKAVPVLGGGESETAG